MTEKQYAIGKPFDIIGDSVKLSEEHQKLLINFLLNILKDTKYIQVKCDCSHEDLYHEVVENMEELGIVNIREDWSIDNPSDWKVRLTFRYPLRNLLYFKVRE